jgi:hypothetical protein
MGSLKGISENNGMGEAVWTSTEAVAFSVVVCCTLSAFQVVNEHVIPTSVRDIGPHNYVFENTNEY